tara:strand:+ start:236 stop:607 length:372 start_codon:yes stop_codon:yes gene_type:complete
MAQPAAPVATTSGANITSDENQGFAQASLGGMEQVQPTPSIQPPAPVAPKGGPGGGFVETTQPAKPATPVPPTQPPAPPPMLSAGLGGGAATQEVDPDVGSMIQAFQNPGYGMFDIFSDSPWA